MASTFTSMANSFISDGLVANLPHTRRLGGYDDFVDLIQDPFTALLPPEPSPFFKYSAELEGGYVLTVLFKF